MAVIVGIPGIVINFKTVWLLLCYLMMGK